MELSKERQLWNDIFSILFMWFTLRSVNTQIKLLSAENSEGLILPHFWMVVGVSQWHDHRFLELIYKLLPTSSHNAAVKQTYGFTVRLHITNAYANAYHKLIFKFVKAIITRGAKLD